MQVVHYYCDLCKVEVAKSNELFGVGARIEYPDQSHYSTFNVSWCKKICKDCMTKVGITQLPEQPTDKQLKEVIEDVRDRLFNVIQEILMGNS